MTKGETLLDAEISEKAETEGNDEEEEEDLDSTGDGDFDLDAPLLLLPLFLNGTDCKNFFSKLNCLALEASVVASDISCFFVKSSLDSAKRSKAGDFGLRSETKFSFGESGCFKIGSSVDLPVFSSPSANGDFPIDFFRLRKAEENKLRRGLEDGDDAGEHGGGVEGREVGVGDRHSRESHGEASSKLERDNGTTVKGSSPCVISFLSSNNCASLRGSERN